jgi:hypothetical protein
VGVPLSLATTWTVAAVAAASGALCIIAVLRASLGLATAGAALALLSLALALRDASSSAYVLVLAAFGSAVLLLADGTHLCKRFEGASVARVLWQRYIAWWTARAAFSLGLALMIAVVAPLIALSLPQPWAPFVAGIGVLAAFTAALAYARAGRDD